MRLGRSLGMRLGRSLEPGNEAGEESGNMDACSPSSVTHQLVKKTHKLLVKGKRMFLPQDVDVPRWLTYLSRLAPQ